MDKKANFEGGRDQSSELRREQLLELSRYYKKAPDGQMVNDLYCASTRKAAGGIEMRIPRLRLATSAADLREDPDARRYAYPDYSQPIYDESGMDIGHHWVGPRGGIQEYLVYREQGRPPMYVFDNHNHALFAWQEAREAGVIRDGAILIHIDDHDDLTPFNTRNMPPARLTRQFIRDKIGEDYGEISIKSFIEPAIADGLIAEVFFVHGVIDDLGKIAVGGSGYMHDLIAQNSLKMLPLSEQDNLERLKGILTRMHGEGKDIILDIDFDVFRPELDEERRRRLKRILSVVKEYAAVITCATSPGYGSHASNVNHAREFIQDYFANK